MARVTNSWHRCPKTICNRKNWTSLSILTLPCRCHSTYLTLTSLTQVDSCQWRVRSCPLADQTSPLPSTESGIAQWKKTRDEHRALSEKIRLLSLSRRPVTSSLYR